MTVVTEELKEEDSETQLTEPAHLRPRLPRLRALRRTRPSGGVRDEETPLRRRPLETSHPSVRREEGRAADG